jgi:hypothetical protein
MKKLFYLFASLTILLAACGQAASTTPTLPVSTQASVPSATPQPPTETPTSQSTMTQAIPVEGYGPSGFPSNVDPLTGLAVADPSLLDRRPMLIKVANIPRSYRPQWGLSLADIVFEYYTEEGSTRFSAVFYGNNADMVGPIRSGRFIDADLVRGYKAVFAFGSAYQAEMDRFLSSEFADRLVMNTADLSAYATAKGINGKQDLDGMSFNSTIPDGGQPGTQIFVRYSGAIYNRWDYDTTSGTYLRYSDTADDYNNNNEQYAQLTDRLTNQPIAFNNVVILYVTHELYSPGIYDILLSGSGDGYAFRDGQAYQVKWHRNDTDVVSLTNPDGTPFAFKPGNTWFEVVGLNSQVQQTDQSWRFTHIMP